MTMGNAYDDFSQMLSALDHTLDELDTSLRTSLAEWAGEARQAFDISHQEWRQAASDMSRRLATLRRVIEVADGNYAQCEAANLKMFGHDQP